MDLTEKGREEAKQAGQTLKKEGYVFDMAFTSVLKRAVDTLKIVLGEMGESSLPVEYSWRLNERHYGALQGITHTEMEEKHGIEQVKLWRRNFDVQPPMLSEDDPRYPGNDPKYKDLKKEEIPKGESLKDTIARVLPYWHSDIAPKLKEGKKIIISASGNSLRALVKYLDNMGDDEVAGLEIATGIPLIYELDENLKPIKHYYLGDNETIEKGLNFAAK